jgi:type VI secretion system protein ImpG
MHDYFAAEMRLLQEAMQHFAASHPQQSGLLGDPSVERLCEGFAFLSSQIKQQIDADWPEICEQFLMQCWPYLLRPIPALSIVQFTPHLSLHQGISLPKGSQLIAHPIGDEHIACQFQTITPVTIFPLHISGVTSSAIPQGGTTLKISLHCNNNLSLSQLRLQSLKFYLATDLALDLYYLLTSQVIDVQIAFPELPQQIPQILGKQDLIKPCHLSIDEALLPMPKNSYLGFHLLMDYFALTEKYCFIELNNLHAIAWPNLNCQCFDIIINIKESLPAYKPITLEALRLYCAPIINLYQTSSEPIHISPEKNNYPLILHNHQQEGLKLYSLDEIVGIDINNDERYTYMPLHHFNLSSAISHHYQLSRQTLPDASPRLTITGHAHEYLSCSVSVCNGNYPQLYGTPLEVTLVENISVKAHIITPFTPMLTPPEQHDLAWQMMAHLSFNYQVLNDVKALQQLLTCYNWSYLPVMQHRIQALLAISTACQDKIQHGILMRILSIQLIIQENAFFSFIEIYLFGTVLQQFFSIYCQLNNFVQMNITCQPSQRRFLWQPLPGQNPPL